MPVEREYNAGEKLSFEPSILGVIEFYVVQSWLCFVTKQRQTKEHH